MLFPYSQKKEMLSTDKASGYLLAETEHNNFVELLIKENGVIPAHAMPVEVTFYIVSGSGIITIDGEPTKASQGDMIHVKKNAERGWENPNSADLKLFAVKGK